MYEDLNIGEVCELVIGDEQDSSWFFPTYNEQ